MRTKNNSRETGAVAGQAGRAAAARAATAAAVSAVYHGRSLDAALAEIFSAPNAELDSERSLIQEMAYGALRWHFQLQPLLRAFLEKPFKDKDADLEALLVIGLYQLLYMRVAPHAAVKETVEATLVLKKGWAKGLTNAVLRRVLREIEQIRARMNDDASLTFAHPEWLLTRLKQAYPENWMEIAAANNARPPFCLRVHVGKISRVAYLDRLRQAGLEARPVADVDSAIVVESPVPVEALPGFRRGEVSIQDAAAQLSAMLLDARPGERILDACAAPGGKAAHILERTPRLSLLALDVDAQRLGRVRENFERLGLTASVAQGDATDPSGWWDGQAFDQILLDAPCSATGVIRRHPDIRLHRTPADISRLAATQARLLDALWPLLAPGGKLLYVTCSILPEENAQQMAALLQRQPAAQVQPLVHPALQRYAHPAGAGFQVLPGTGGLDGFYFASLIKNQRAT